MLPRSVIAAERAGGFRLLPFQRAFIQDKSAPPRYVQNGELLITAVRVLLAHNRLMRYAALAPAGVSAT